MPAQRGDLQSRTGGKDDHGGGQTSKILPGEQNFAPHGSQQIEVQALVQHFSAEQVREDSHAAEEYRQAQVEELEYGCEDGRVLGDIATVLFVNVAYFT